jgi:uncharacterized membrane protein YidH (DUF202 family)
MLHLAHLCTIDTFLANVFKSTAALERTFLAYLRTSLMMAIIGTIISQLFTLEQSDTGFGFSLVGRPLAITCYCFSIGTVLLGAIRASRFQHAMIQGKALSGGFEIATLAIGLVAVSECPSALSLREGSSRAVPPDF